RTVPVRYALNHPALWAGSPFSRNAGEVFDADYLHPPNVAVATAQPWSLARFEKALGSKPRVANSPAALRRQPEAVEIEVNDGRRVEGQQLADEQPADDRDPERLAQFGTLAKAERQRHRPEHRRHRRHDDRPETFEAGLINRLARCQTLAALSIEGEIYHHDRVLFDDPDQQNDTDHRHDAELGIGDDQCQDRADPCRWQGRQDRDRVDKALIEHPKHDIDGE